MDNILEGLDAGQEMDLREIITGEVADWLSRQPASTWIRVVETLVEEVGMEGWDLKSDIRTIRSSMLERSRT